MKVTVGSLFTGVGGFDLGLECAGMDVAWQVEADKWCQQVLRARWPDVNLYGDVKDVGPADLDGVDLICGGFPCQDVSVAGRREGLAAERSGLFFEFVRIADSLAPRWLLVENVPGLLSSNDGEDFATVLRELTGFHPAVPDEGWNDGGFCKGPKRRCFWRVLDTQHFGPPQRRRRVFLVCDSLARCGPEILLEPESLPGDSAAGREAGEGSAGGSSAGFAKTGRGFWRRGPGTLSARDWRDQAHLVLNGPYGRDRSHALSNPGTSAGRLDPHGETFVAFNATQDPITDRKAGALSAQGAACFNLRGRNEGAVPEEDDKASVRGSEGGSSRSYVYPTLRENYRNNSNPATEARMLAWQGGKHTTGYQGDRAVHPEGQACTLPGSGANNGGGGGQILGQAIPRRLTPRECERLQGFPDDWTATGIDADGEPVEISDTQRYKQMGNAVSVPVAAWIGARIVASEMGAIKMARELDA